ncbi:MAG: hypothetical protein MI923_07635 [Phycisphaerales bacterium]|nr:hypothetical protein [Phycisphaerales bacterium]
MFQAMAFGVREEFGSRGRPTTTLFSCQEVTKLRRNSLPCAGDTMDSYRFQRADQGEYALRGRHPASFR